MSRLEFHPFVVPIPANDTTAKDLAAQVFARQKFEEAVKFPTTALINKILGSAPRWARDLQPRAAVDVDAFSPGVDTRAVTVSIRPLSPR